MSKARMYGMKSVCVPNSRAGNPRWNRRGYPGTQNGKNEGAARDGRKPEKKRRCNDG